MMVALLIIHGLLAVALLGAITHQAIGVWLPARPGPEFFKPKDGLAMNGSVVATPPSAHGSSRRSLRDHRALSARASGRCGRG